MQLEKENTQLLDKYGGNLKKNLNGFSGPIHDFPSLSINYRKIPKISLGADIFQRPFLRGLYSEGLMYGGKFAFQNRLG